MNAYILVLTLFGALVLMTAWLPMALQEAPLSLPIVCVALGAAIFGVIGQEGFAPHPGEHLPIVERLTEFVVVISLMGAGLKLDRPPSRRSWIVTWRMLGFAMPLTIAALTLLGYGLLGLGWATALLLAACLAPTDAVLASDVQVGPPGGGEEDEARFALTSEAGLNDGLAFPFVHAAIALAAIGTASAMSFSAWLSIYVVWKVAAGVAVGWAVGFVMGWLIFHIPNRAKLSRTGDGFVALGATCLAYGLAEMAYGYGFLAVFVAALALRAAERGNAYHQKLHDFAEELERLPMMALLVLFGGALTDGGLLSALTWPAAVFGLTAIFLVRPLSGWIGLAGAGCPAPERAAISFYGIRGMGTVYYLAYALERRPFEQAPLVWSTAAFIILVSILLHGATVTPIMRRLDAMRGRRKYDEGAVPEASEAVVPRR